MSIENVCHRTGISGNCGEGCEAYMIYEECGFLEEAMETKDALGHVIVPIKGKILDTHRNKHPDRFGYAWGWISGCEDQVIWDNKKDFNSNAAEKFVDDWNKAHE